MYFNSCTIKILQEFIDIHYLYILSGGTAPADADQNQTKLRTKAIQNANSIKAPSEWFPLTKPQKWTFQRNKVPTYGGLKYNTYSFALTPNDFTSLAKAHLQPATAPKQSCVCNIDTHQIEESADGLVSEAKHVKEKVKALCNSINLTFDRLTEKRSALANLIDDTDKWMLHCTRQVISKVDNINSQEKIEELIAQARAEYLEVMDAEQEAQVLNRPMDPRLPTTIQEFKTYQMFKLCLAHILAQGKAPNLSITTKDLNIEPLTRIPEINKTQLSASLEINSKRNGIAPATSPKQNCTPSADRSSQDSQTQIADTPAMSPPSNNQLYNESQSQNSYVNTRPFEEHLVLS